MTAKPVPLIIMKFGGASIEDAASIRRVIDLILARLPKKIVLVFSAMGKTTRKLLEAARFSAQGRTQEARSILDFLRRMHDDPVGEIVSPAHQEEIRSAHDVWFSELRTLFDGLAILRELTPRIQDRILSYGELMATRIMTAALRSRGAKAEWLDSRHMIITDDRFTCARPLEGVTDKAVREEVLPVLRSGHLPVLQGFIGSTSEGVTTTLGFEGSDYTAALVGAALDAQDIQIWKNVHGLMTADPALVPGAKTVETLTFGEAALLTFLGAKVLHPSAVEPAFRKAIPIHIYDVDDPDSRGTEILDHPGQKRAPVVSIAYKKPVTLLRLRSGHAQPVHEFLRTVADILDRDRVVPFLMNAMETALIIAMDECLCSSVIVDDLKRVGDVDVRPGMAVVSMVGERFGNNSGILDEMFSVLGKIPVASVSIGATAMGSALVVDQADVPTVLAKLHRHFFEK
jgi:aspartate kinase